MKILHRAKLIYLTLLFVLGAYLWPYLNYCLANHVSFFSGKNQDFFSGINIYILVTFPLVLSSIYFLKRWSPYLIFFITFVIFCTVFQMVWKTDNKILVLINGLFLYLSFSQCLYLFLELNLPCYPKATNFESEWNYCNKKIPIKVLLANGTELSAQLLEWSHASALIQLKEVVSLKHILNSKILKIEWSSRLFEIEILPVIYLPNSLLIGVKVVHGDNGRDTEKSPMRRSYKEFYDLSKSFAFGENKLT